MQYDVAEARGRRLIEGRRRAEFTSWADRVAPAAFIMPAVLTILALSIFPLIVSVYLSLSRIKFEKGGVTVTFIGLLNYKKLLFGSQQFHLIGTLMPLTPLGWTFVAIVVAVMLLWLVTAVRRGTGVLGLVGRLLIVVALVALALLLTSAAGEGGQLGTIGV